VKSIYKSVEGERAVRDEYARFLKHWPVPNRQFHVPTREGDTFAIACGREGAPPLVLLHGSGFNSVTWMGDVTAWSEHFRVYAVDVIGHPGFSAASRPSYGSDAYASWLDDVLNALAVGRASIVGISLGGWLGIDYAVRRPERVASLVLLCPGGVGRELIGSFKLLFGILPLMLFGERGRRKAMEKMLGPVAFEDSREAHAVAAFMNLVSKHFRQNLAKVTRFDDAALERLTMPVFAIVGGRDPMLDSQETKQRLERRAADAQVLYLPDVGHAVVGQTEPILEFLRRKVK
jgi:pimeloyl-ACP methyl ester carboxylesterase